MSEKPNDNWKISHEWIPGCRESARKLFPNQGLHNNAEFIASLHPNAIDYLTQAPVLACAMGAKLSTRADRLFIGSRLGGPIERGEKLRSVMASVGLPQPLRQILPFALSPGARATIFRLAQIPPSPLALMIPAQPGKQRNWLSNLKVWTGVFIRRGVMVEQFDWAAREISRSDARSNEVSTVADFLISNRAIFNPRWSWDRAMTEAELWHDRLASERNLSQLGGGIRPDTQIDWSDGPLEESVDGFTFVKLITPLALLNEGRRMRHCVASYIPDVINGICSIYSVRQGERRLATLEIAGSEMRQLKGFANAAPAKEVKQAVARFLAATPARKD